MSSNRLTLIVALLVMAGCAGTGATVETSGTQRLAAGEVALLEVPYALTLVNVDGIKAEPAQTSNDYQVRLRPGRRTLRFAYEFDWGKAGSYDWVYSKQVVEVVLQAEAGETYRVGYPEPSDKYAAIELAESLRVWVDLPDGTRLQSRVAGSHGSPLSRLFSGGDVDTSASVGQGGSIVVPGGGVDQAEEVLARQDALERLKLWWKLASDGDRAAFRQWIEEN